MSTIDIKNISIYNFLEIANSQWVIEQYLKSIPDIQEEYFSLEDENKISLTSEFNILESSIHKKFSWKL